MGLFTLIPIGANDTKVFGKGLGANETTVPLSEFGTYCSRFLPTGLMQPGEMRFATTKRFPAESRSGSPVSVFVGFTRVTPLPAKSPFRCDICRHKRLNRLRLLVIRKPLIRPENEDLVLDERPPGRCAKLILLLQRDPR